MYQNIVCALDLSPCSEATCRRAITLAKHSGAKLTLLFVVEHFPESPANALFAPELNDPPEERERQAKEGLHELAERLGYTEAAYAVGFTKHSAWQEVIRFAEEREMDLIVAGSHGGFGLNSLLTPTSSNIVNQAHCDVLLVHDPQ